MAAGVPDVKGRQGREATLDIGPASGRDRLHHWRIAYGSAKEVDCHLRLLAHAGAIDRQHATAILDRFDQVRAMTWRLLHPMT